jgi:hypothetical protein
MYSGSETKASTPALGNENKLSLCTSGDLFIVSQCAGMPYKLQYAVQKGPIERIYLLYIILQCLQAEQTATVTAQRRQEREGELTCSSWEAQLTRSSWKLSRHVDV